MKWTYFNVVLIVLWEIFRMDLWKFEKVVTFNILSTNEWHLISMEDLHLSLLTCLLQYIFLPMLNITFSINHNLILFWHLKYLSQTLITYVLLEWWAHRGEGGEMAPPLTVGEWLHEITLGTNGVLQTCL